jgi:hypothetical protein
MENTLPRLIPVEAAPDQTMPHRDLPPAAHILVV